MLPHQSPRPGTWPCPFSLLGPGLRLTWVDSHPACIYTSKTVVLYVGPRFAVYFPSLVCSTTPSTAQGQVVDRILSRDDGILN